MVLHTYIIVSDVYAISADGQGDVKPVIDEQRDGCSFCYLV